MAGDTKQVLGQVSVRPTEGFPWDGGPASSLVLADRSVPLPMDSIPFRLRTTCGARMTSETSGRIELLFSVMATQRYLHLVACPEGRKQIENGAINEII